MSTVYFALTRIWASLTSALSQLFYEAQFVSIGSSPWPKKLSFLQFLRVFAIKRYRECTLGSKQSYLCTQKRPFACANDRLRMQICQKESDLANSTNKISQNGAVKLAKMAHVKTVDSCAQFFCHWFVYFAHMEILYFLISLFWLQTLWCEKFDCDNLGICHRRKNPSGVIFTKNMKITKITSTITKLRVVEFQVFV